MTQKQEPRTIVSLRLLENGTSGKQKPLLDVLTAQPRPFSTKILLFALPKSVFDRACSSSIVLSREDLQLAQRTLYRHVYQAVGSLILAILNTANARKIRDATDLIENGFHEYQANQGRLNEILVENGFTHTSSPDGELEEGVTLARELRSRVDSLIVRLAEAPHRLDLCQDFAKACEEFRGVFHKVQHSRFIDHGTLVSFIPSFDLRSHGLCVQTLDQLLDFLGGTDNPFIQDFSEMRLDSRFAGVHIRLLPNACESTTFSPFIPCSLSPEIKPVGLLVEANSNQDGTYFADMFTILERRLMRLYDSETVTITSDKAVRVFFPKLADSALLE